MKKFKFLALPVLAVGLLVGCSETEISDNKEEVIVAEEKPTVTEEKPTVTEEKPTVTEEKPTVAVEETKKLTTSQEQAIKKAESYLDFTAFSKTGLSEQLVFEGFSNEDATFAVNNIVVDWNEQAAKKAKSYLDFSAFSKAGLIEQLVFEGFTNEEATYGVTQVGL